MTSVKDTILSREGKNRVETNVRLDTENEVAVACHTAMRKDIDMCILIDEKGEMTLEVEVKNDKSIRINKGEEVMEVEIVDIARKNGKPREDNEEKSQRKEHEKYTERQKRKPC